MSIDRVLDEFPPVDGPVRSGAAHLRSTPDRVRWGRLPRGSDRPVLTVAPGDTFVVDTVSHEGLLEDQGRDPIAFFGAHGVPPRGVLADAVLLARELGHDPRCDGPHVVTGPIAVVGAAPGDHLAVTTVALEPRVGYGVVSSRHRKGALPDEVAEGEGPWCTFATAERSPHGLHGRIDSASGRLLRFPLRPFLGLVGVATAGSERLHSVPPGLHGGNLDVSVLGVGSTLFLPVQVPDALLYVGDPHFAQGDGEVALTAFEAPLRATLRVEVLPAATARSWFGAHQGPWGETEELLVAIGLDEDLDEAMRAAVRQALAVLHHRYGIDRRSAYAYLSAAADFAVSQVVDGVKGVHSKIHRRDLLGQYREEA